MPEGDTVWRTAHRLSQVFAGEALTRCDLRWPELSTIDFRGATTIEVVSRGKHLLHRLDNGFTIHSHLRMEGQWRIADAATARPDAYTRAFLGTERWAALGQRLGMLDVVRTIAENTLVGHLGPDVLGPDWDAERAAANLARGDTIGAALLDQTNLAGVGTIYASETLFMERINPWSSPAELPTPPAARSPSAPTGCWTWAGAMPSNRRQATSDAARTPGSTAAPDAPAAAAAPPSGRR